MKLGFKVGGPLPRREEAKPVLREPSVAGAHLPPGEAGDSQIKGHFFSLIADSLIRQYLVSNGYAIIGNSSGYNVTRAFQSEEFRSATQRGYPETKTCQV